VGWQSLHGGQAKKDFYVSDLNEWKALRTVRQQKANQCISTEPALGKTFFSKDAKISLIYFFLLFVLASGFLWLSPKL